MTFKQFISQYIALGSKWTDNTVTPDNDVEDDNS